MLPEVVAFKEALTAARTTFSKEQSALYALDRNLKYDDEAWYQRRAAMDVALKKATTEAWDKLEESDDPVIRFIAVNCRSYRDEAIEVMEMAPITDVKKLTTYADDRDWCSTWDEFFEQAMGEGVLPGASNVDRAEFALSAYLRREYEASGDDLKTVMELVHKLIDAHVHDALAGKAVEGPTS